MKNKVLALAGISVLLVSCKTIKETKQKNDPIDVVALPEMTVQDSEGEKKEVEIPLYQASNTKVNDLIHTKLEVKFDWAKQHLLGKATLTLRPYFYQTKELVLDAKGFDIHSITMKGNPLLYKYDGMKITIQLGNYYTRKEEYTVVIDYTAKPNELKASGSSAITDEKGLYFINPLGKDKNKMPQIWTQGETESSSCWFPTIDSPNEKTTQEIYMTVKDKFLTLSNGKLISSKKNSDGTRTDYWKQDLKHAPYLFMMAVGEFDITQDSWTRPDGSKMEVNYYTEPEYTPYAKSIFGKTPKMIQFFSDKLGVEYPWNKYNQIVVRDYVSGAMENTTAVIHGDFLYQTDRELLDSDNESIIAHELFHHWFGDLVTCESWSNLSMNESFANYSQYLWDEFEHGRSEADKNAYGEMRGYFLSSVRGGYHDLVNFEYKDEMEMFDGHSYNKGGRILHMLRYYVGDEAFFLSLKHYLNKRKFNTAEAHDLRLSFEEITGKDLNWFFNQWFFDKGHPTLHYSQSYDESNQELTLTVEQKQDFGNFPLFQLPIDVDVYTEDGKARETIWVTKSNQSFVIKSKKPKLVNFDAEKVILCKKQEDKPTEQWVYQLEQTKLYLDKKEALAQLKNNTDKASVRAIFNLLNEPYSEYNNMGMKNLAEVHTQLPSELKDRLVKLTKHTSSSSVRANAYRNLERYYNEDDGHESMITEGLKDQSYQVMGVCLKSLANSNPSKAMEFAGGLEKEKSSSVKAVIASLYAEHGTKDNHGFFINSISQSSGFAKYGLLNQYSSYLSRLEVTDLSSSYAVYEDVAKNSSAWWMKMVGYQGLIASKNRMTNRVSELETELSSVTDATKKSKLERGISDCKSELTVINKLYKTLKSEESDKKVIDYLDNMN